MEIQELEFSTLIDAEAVAAHLEALARQFRTSQFSFEADGETLRFEVTGQVEFELAADYNPEKNKYSVKLEMDWRNA